MRKSIKDLHFRKWRDVGRHDMHPIRWGDAIENWEGYSVDVGTIGETTTYGDGGGGAPSATPTTLPRSRGVFLLKSRTPLAGGRTQGSAFVVCE